MSDKHLEAFFREPHSPYWFEVWYQGTEPDPPDILLVLPAENGQVNILDVREKNEIGYVAEDYEDARNWLTEGGFSRFGERASR